MHEEGVSDERTIILSSADGCAEYRCSQSFVKTVPQLRSFAVLNGNSYVVKVQFEGRTLDVLVRLIRRWQEAIVAQHSTEKIVTDLRASIGPNVPVASIKLLAQQAREWNLPELHKACCALQPESKLEHVQLFAKEHPVLVAGGIVTGVGLSAAAVWYLLKK